MGYIRHQFAIAQYGEGFDPALLGFPAAQVAPLARKFFPRIDYTDYSAFGPQRSTGSEFTFSDTWSIAETLNKVVGQHSVKFGAEFRLMFNNQDRPTSSFARFNFTKAYTQRNPLQGDAASGNAFASLLLGFPASGTSDFNAAPAYGNRYYVLFFQDDWRVSRKLTLNLGLRWDYESPVSERFNRQNRGFDAAASNPFQVPGLQLKGGLLFTDQERASAVPARPQQLSAAHRRCLPDCLEDRLPRRLRYQLSADLRSGPKQRLQRADTVCIFGG